MNYFNWIFGKKELIDIKISEPLSEIVRDYLHYDDTSNKYPFGEKLSNENIDKMAKYINDNMESWTKDGLKYLKYDDFIYHLNRYTTNIYGSVSNKKYMYSEITFHPQYYGYWFKLESGVQLNNSKRSEYECKKIKNSFNSNKDINSHQALNKYNTPDEIYKLFYNLFTKGEKIYDRVQSFESYQIEY